MSGLLASKEEGAPRDGLGLVDSGGLLPTEVLIRVRRAVAAACPRCRRHTATAADRPCSRCEAVLATL